METQFTEGKHGGGSGFSEEMEIDVDFEGCIGIYQEKLSKGIIRSETSTCKAWKDTMCWNSLRNSVLTKHRQQSRGRQAVC